MYFHSRFLDCTFTKLGYSGFGSSNKSEKKRYFFQYQTNTKNVFDKYSKSDLKKGNILKPFLVIFHGISFLFNSFLSNVIFFLWFPRSFLFISEYGIKYESSYFISIILQDFFWKAAKYTIKLIVIYIYYW